MSQIEIPRPSLESKPLTLSDIVAWTVGKLNSGTGVIHEGHLYYVEDEVYPEGEEIIIRLPLVSMDADPVQD